MYNNKPKLTPSLRNAIDAYKQAIRRQNTMPSDLQWTMGTELKQLKAKVYLEMELAKLNIR